MLVSSGIVQNSPVSFTLTEQSAFNYITTLIACKHRCSNNDRSTWPPIWDLLNEAMTVSSNHHVICLCQMYQHRIQKIQDKRSETRLSSATVRWKTQQVTQRTRSQHHLCDGGRSSPAGAESDSVTRHYCAGPHQTSRDLKLLFFQTKAETKAACWTEWAMCLGESIQNKVGWPREVEVASGQSLEVGQTEQNREECKCACFNVDADKATLTTEM